MIMNISLSVFLMLQLNLNPCSSYNLVDSSDSSSDIRPEEELNNNPFITEDPSDQQDSENWPHRYFPHTWPIDPLDSL